jgi:uracil-DNA glycosylase
MKNQTKSSKDNPERLNELNQREDKNNVCELKKTATQAVFGHGNPNAKIVFIGEAPGKREDISGTPFVGSAGKILNEMLSEISMKREDIYITNVVKYRPPNNRDPKQEEIEGCLPWLIEEIKIINPELIVFLGRHALNIFFPEEKISEVHGKILKKEIKNLGEKKFLALYHPAAAIYNRSLRATLSEDFKMIKNLL